MKMLAICGYQNAGKTTLIERLLPLLSADGIRTAVVKHEGHFFRPDVPGTDSFRFFAAGACGSAVFDGEKYTLTRRAAAAISELAACFPEADLILVEGLKHSSLPKIELVRRELGQSPVCDPDTCLAYVSDQPIPGGKPVFSPCDAAAVERYIRVWLARPD